MIAGASLDAGENARRCQPGAQGFGPADGFRYFGGKCLAITIAERLEMRVPERRGISRPPDGLRVPMHIRLHRCMVAGRAFYRHAQDRAESYRLAGLLIGCRHRVDRSSQWRPLFVTRAATSPLFGEGAARHEAAERRKNAPLRGLTQRGRPVAAPSYSLHRRMLAGFTRLHRCHKWRVYRSPSVPCLAGHSISRRGRLLPAPVDYPERAPCSGSSGDFLHLRRLDSFRLGLCRRRHDNRTRGGALPCHDEFRQSAGKRLVICG